MKISVLEPLGIPEKMLVKKIRQATGSTPQLVCYDDRKEDEASLIARSKDADIVVLSNIRYSESVLEHCPYLKLICVAFTGVDHIDLDYCKARGITVCNCAGYSTVAVADLVFALVLDLARNILDCDKACRTSGTKNGLVGFELEGKKFGIIGLGAIGTRVAEIANAFGCEVYTYTRTKKEVANVTFCNLDTLLNTCDIISIHVPQNSDTIGMIGKRELSLMKSSALLINTARGPIVDMEALSEALTDGTIAGAGIDVFAMEPPIPEDYPLLHAPHAIVTPHIAFATTQAFEKRADIIAENLRQWLHGTPVNVIVR
ncbi:MAG: NAD(P)-binding domain-containing protein [Spirochaetia bacterium]|jgi:D-3-phosphoglycerate dehydrogenase|nr:NAD(P)-binding domain-containing protein [Spirochaetia bacterium]